MTDPVVITGWVVVAGALIFYVWWWSPRQRSKRRRAEARARVAFRRTLRSDGRDRHTFADGQTPGPALRDLYDLINTGGWRQLPGPPDVLIFVHPYPDGSVDTLAIMSETDTFAERTNSFGAPVWHRGGGLSEIIGLLRALPDPTCGRRIP